MWRPSLASSARSRRASLTLSADFLLPRRVIVAARDASKLAAVPGLDASLVLSSPDVSATNVFKLVIMDIGGI